MTVNSKPVVNLKSVFSDKSFLKNLFIIAVPIILQNFISSFVNILDTIMIGRLGTIELAAVGLGNQLFFLLNLILYGIGSGGMVFTAQFWGKKDFNGLQKTFSVSLIVAVFFSTLFTLACTIFPKEILSLFKRCGRNRKGGRLPQRFGILLFALCGKLYFYDYPPFYRKGKGSGWCNARFTFCKPYTECYFDFRFVGLPRTRS